MTNLNLINKSNLVKLSQSLNCENSLETSVKSYSINNYYLEITCPLKNDLTAQYQVLGWANSTNIPVLYVNLMKSDDSIITDFQEFEKEAKLDKQCMISQGESPINGLPSFFIHPCKTEEFLKDMEEMVGEGTRSDSGEKKDIEYRILCLWLETFGGMVGLKMRNRLGII